MKHGLQIALLLFLAVIAASAQSAGSQQWPANVENVTTMAQEYAACVDGLLREVHASLHEISERMVAGRLTSQQAQALKLAATRDLIARLETLSAVYDAKLEAKGKGEPDGKWAACGLSVQSTAAGTGRDLQRTVSIVELRREISK